MFRRPLRVHAKKQTGLESVGAQVQLGAQRPQETPRKSRREGRRTRRPAKASPLAAWSGQSPPQHPPHRPAAIWSGRGRTLDRGTRPGPPVRLRRAFGCTAIVTRHLRQFLKCESAVRLRPGALALPPVGQNRRERNESLLSVLDVRLTAFTTP